KPEKRLAALAGFNAPAEQWPGWHVDVLSGDKYPFYDQPNHAAITGVGGKPTIIWDTPNNWKDDPRIPISGLGRSFVTTVFCEGADGKRIPIASLLWGFRIDKNGT